MILITGHDIKRNPCPGFAYHLQQILHQPLKNEHLFRQTDIVDPFGRVGTESGTHAAR